MNKNIDWTKYNWANWHAADSQGNGHFFSTKPYPKTAYDFGYWTFDDGAAASSGVRYDITKIDWRDTLTQRPQVQK